MNKFSHLNKTVLVSALMLATGAQAATINVDGVTCTLNDAVRAANIDTATGGCDAGSGADVLELPVDANLEISGTLNITSLVTINGNGSTIQPSAGNDIRVFNVNGGNLNLNDADITTTYVGVTGGVSTFGAGSVLNTNNVVVRDIPSGGIVFGNGASGTINNTLIKNTGGSNNNYYGAGLSVGSSTVIVTNSTISNNSNDPGPTAGGIWVNNFYGATSLQVFNSTITGNSTVNNGGGIGHNDYGNGSTISLTNVTIAANTAAGAGGGISNDAADITITQSIISGNTGTGGAEIDSSGGTITVDDYNLFGLNSTSGVVGVTVGASDIVPTLAALSDIVDVNLIDNGGPTPTHALAAGSPAIDAVPASSCASATDQTGKSRPIDGDADGTADCDVGAFENSFPDVIFENGFEN